MFQVMHTHQATLNITECSLRQISGIKNSLGRQLDLIFVNKSAVDIHSQVLSAVAPLLRPDDYHPALEFSLSANIQKAPRSVSSNIRKYNLKKWITLNFQLCFRIISEFF